MKKLLIFDALLSQNGDNLPEIHLRKDEIGISIEMLENAEQNGFEPGTFFLVSDGKFTLGKTSAFAQPTISNEGWPYDIVFDFPAYEPNKILMRTVLPDIGSKNGLLNYTPIVITIEVEETITPIEEICLNKAKNVFLKNGISPDKFLK